MNAFETGLLRFLAAAAPTIGTLFIHNTKSIAIFNASDEFFTAAVASIPQPAVGTSTQPNVNG